MPQHTQHSLIHVLLLWITILSIVQVVFIVLFFTAGHHSLSQNSDAVATVHSKKIHENTTPSLTPDHGLPLGKGLMLTFKITEGNKGIQLIAENPYQGLFSQEETGGKVLKIKKDGYFFLSLQVTLLNNTNHTITSQHTVSLKLEDKVVLKGFINKDTRSTGLLGMVKDIPAGATLEVNLTDNDQPIDDRYSHLNIIYMLKP